MTEEDRLKYLRKRLVHLRDLIAGEQPDISILVHENVIQLIAKIDRWQIELEDHASELEYDI